MEKVDQHTVKQADIIVGIPSYNEADNISYVVKQSNLGLRKYFPNLKSVIINVDNNSPDDTRSAFLNSMNTIPKVYVSTPPGVQGKGNNFFNLFREASQLKAKAIVVVDADLTSITPEWIKNLAAPVLEENYDFVTPYYSRNEYDGTITNNICYPLIYGLLGRDIRQPIGGDFALSGKLGEYYLQQEWHQTTRQYGVDIFMTLHAIIGGFKLGQVGLGAKIHKPSAPKLGPMFTQVVGTLFETLLACRSDWQFISGVDKLPFFGEKMMVNPQSLSVDYKSMKATAQYEFNLYREVLSQSLSTKLFRQLAPMFESGKLSIGMDLWAKAVYDLMFSYASTDFNSELVEGMKAIYFGRVVSFIRQTLDMNHTESEQQIQKQADHFYRLREYLLRKFEGQSVHAA